MASAKDYDAAARAIRQLTPEPPPGSLDTERLVRLATLAASNHNSQPWKFHIERDRITVLPDYKRRLPVVDTDDRQLFHSLGCAVENLVQAAAAQGFDAEPTYSSTVDGIVVQLERSAWAKANELYAAIPHRQCVRKPYDGQPLGRAELAKLTGIGRGSRAQTLILVTEAAKEAVTEFVTQGNALQLTDRAYRRELAAWMRFNNGEAMRRGDGRSARATGRLLPLPGLLARLMSKQIFDPESHSARDAKQIRRSAGVAVFVASEDDKSTWIDVGRACQRFALQATALDIRTAFINQPIHARALQSQFDEWLQLKGERAMLMLRFGHGPKAPFSLRRPVDEVIVKS
ncbi:nitroreductase [Thioflavicoccus mobilis 8321]|uniref:Nitroreductase n=1 Tax=Thioflavicoccus mobilis 8321 TaxID=765912 RepID=L0GVN5_9GAMM|nr:nitroreductase family protein [Thioflavicoccus mobilis]AGA90828.1 nitroreductase [Thioflavicoccus mobilis 8321]